jgi:hypothetical protein
MPVTIAKPKVPLIIAKPKGPCATAVSKPPVQPSNVAKSMAAAGLMMSAAGKHVDDPAIKEMLTEGAFDLYKNIPKRDALDCILALHAASITSMNVDCLSQAALSPPDHLKIRDLNLRQALKGTATVLEIVKALDNRSGEKSEKVTVGQVNVEAGGQAIVGNVEAAPPPGASPTKPSKTD